MALQTGLVTSATWEKTGGGTPVTVAKNLLSFPTLSFDPETIALANGINLRLRDRDEIVVRVHDISTFAALRALMVTRDQLEFTLTGGSVYVWDPVNFDVVYVFDQVPNASEIFIGADGATSDPTTTPANWTSLGKIEGGSAPNVSIVGRNDGVGLRIYTGTSLDWTLRLLGSPATALTTLLASYQRALCRIAIKSPDGTFLMLGGASAGQGVTAQWSRAPRFGVDEFSSAVDLNLSGVAENPDNLIVIPGAAPDYIYAYDLTMTATSTTQSNYLTVT